MPRQVYPTLLIFAALLLAACGSVPNSSAPPPDAPRATVTFADPNNAARDAANVAFWLAQTATADGANRIATAAVIARATQQVEVFNQQATAQGVAVAATATAAQLSLQRQQIDATATAVALGQARLFATAQAADVEARRVEVEEQAQAQQNAALEWQTGYVVKIGLAALVIVAACIVIFYGARWLSVLISIDARRRLIVERAGLYIDANTSEIRALPGREAPPALPPPDLARPIVINRHGNADPAIQQERAARLAWRNAAADFLRLAAAVGSLSRRDMVAAGATDGDWRAMTALLATLGFLRRDRENGPYLLALHPDGRPMTAREIVRSPRWATSFDVPSAPLPRFDVPLSARTAYTHPPPPHPPRPTPPRNPPEMDGDGDDLDAPTVIPGTWTYATYAARAGFDPAVTGLAVPFDLEED